MLDLAIYWWIECDILNVDRDVLNVTLLPLLRPVAREVLETAFARFLPSSAIWLVQVASTKRFAKGRVFGVRSLIWKSHSESLWKSHSESLRNLTPKSFRIWRSERKLPCGRRQSRSVDFSISAARNRLDYLRGAAMRGATNLHFGSHNQYLSAPLIRQSLESSEWIVWLKSLKSNRRQIIESSESSESNRFS